MEAGDTQIMIAGNLGDDPQLRFTRLGSRPRRSASRPPRGTSTRATFAKSLQHGMRVIYPAAAAAVVRDRGGREADRLRGGHGRRRCTALRGDGQGHQGGTLNCRCRKSAGDSDPWAGEARKVTQALRLSSPPSTESCRCFPRSVRLHYTGMPAVRVTILKYEVCRQGRGNLREAYRPVTGPESDAGRHHPPGRGMPL